MVYLYIDESGDLGFSKKSSKWFLFTLVVTNEPRKLEKIIKRIRKTLKKKHKHEFSELHAYHADGVTRTRVLKSLAETDIFVVTTILNKKKVHVDLQNQKNYLYNYTANIILDRLTNRKLINKEQHISLVVDRKDTKKNLRDNFISYITDAMHKRGHKNFKMSLIASQEGKELQAVDFISWAIFRKYEKGDYEFYEIIKDKIIDEKLLFP